MLPTRDVERYFSYLPPDWLDLILELRSQIFRIAPHACEVFHSRGLSYYFADRGGPVSAGICQIVIKEDHIRLGFVQGSFLPDPAGLLDGDRKAMRYIRITSFDQAPWPDLIQLIEVSSRFDPYTQQFASTTPTEDR
jgi:hypothetical protein